MSSTPNYNLPYPDPDDAPDVPQSLAILALAVELLLSTGEGTPVGSIAHTAGAVPEGWLACDGATHQSATFPALAFALGSADDTFTVPDLRERFVIGAGSGRAVGQSAGSKTVALTEAQMAGHAHSGGTGWMNQNWAHSHDLGAGVIGVYIMGLGYGNNYVGPNYGLWSDTGAGGFAARGGHSHSINGQDLNHTHTFTTGYAGSGTVHNNLSPYMNLTAIIKT